MFVYLEVRFEITFLAYSFLLDQPNRFDRTWQQLDPSVPERQPNGEGVVLGALYLHRQGIKENE